MATPSSCAATTRQANCLDEHQNTSGDDYDDIDFDAACSSFVNNDLNKIISHFCDSTDAAATISSPATTIVSAETTTTMNKSQEKLFDIWKRRYSSCGRPTTSSSSSASTGAATAPADVTAAVCQVYAPRHLQRQFQELYSLLHPCLVVRHQQQHHNPPSGRYQQQDQPQQLQASTNSTTSTTTNRSAFLQGARGSGKSLVLQRCLQAFQDELTVKQQQQQQQQQQHHHSHDPQQQRENQQLKIPPVSSSLPSSSSFFRIVRIHGILVPGSKVEVVVQEILQQLTRSANQQHQQQQQQQHHHQQGNSSSSTPVVVKVKSNKKNNAKISSSDNNMKKNKNKRQKAATAMPAKKRPANNDDMDDSDDDDHASNDDDDDDDDDDNDATTKTTQQAAQQQQQLFFNNCKKEQSMEHLLRLRRTSFTNHFQLLNEILQYACLDRIPILFILDELDTFVSGSGGGSGACGGGSGSNKNDAVDGSNGSNRNANALTVVNKERQVLLYYLLDRVATQGSFLSLVGLSCHLRTAELLEKRVLSRAMGTARFIGFGPPRNFTQLADILQDKFKVHNRDDINSSKQSSKFIATLQRQVALLLSEPPEHEQEDDDDDDEDAPTKSGSESNNIRTTFLEERQQRRRLYETLERSFRLGKDLRWFSRVFTLALALYRLDCRNAIATWSSPATNGMQANENDGNVKNIKSNTTELPVFHPNYLLEALVDMGASFLTQSGEPDLLAAHSHVGMNHSVSTRDRHTTTSSCNNRGSAMAEPRMQALHDLCGPQIVLVLAAKRILTRDVQYSTTTTVPPPLTFQRLWQEYNTTYRGSTNRYGRSLVYKAFHDLLAMGLLQPAMDHSGTVPFQYDYHGEFSSLPPSSLALLPLHFNIDIFREMQKAMDGNILDCPAALREWGKKTH